MALDVVGRLWGAPFTQGGRGVIEKVFAHAGHGARGIVYVRWLMGGAHLFSVENDNGAIRFIDPQTGNPDVSNYFQRSTDSAYLRTDRLVVPPVLWHYVQPVLACGAGRQVMVSAGSMVGRAGDRLREWANDAQATEQAAVEMMRGVGGELV
jgi:hypothetical protein